MLTIQIQQENDICFIINHLSLCDVWNIWCDSNLRGWREFWVCTVMSDTVSWCKNHIMYIPHQSEGLLWISASTYLSIYIWRQTKSHQHNSILYLIYKILWDSSKKESSLLSYPRLPARVDSGWSIDKLRL